MAGNLKFHGLFFAVLLLGRFSFCFSLNIEGKALLRFKDRVTSDPDNALASWKYDEESTPCSWSGVRCSSGGKVVALKLGDLRIGGTLGPELGHLTYLKSLVLRNNSFSGIIPEQIGELKNLRVLDLGHNNFSGPIPSNIGSISSLFLDNNDYLLHQGGTGPRRILKGKEHHSMPPSSAPPPPLISPPSPPPRKHHRPHSLSRNGTIANASTPAVAPSPSPIPIPIPEVSRTSSNHLVPILVGVVGGSTLLIASMLMYFFCRKNKLVTARSWTRVLSGQMMEEARVTGVPKLQRSMLEEACEDFTNIVGTLCDGTVYRGNLLKEDEEEEEEGEKKIVEVPIAVTSSAVKAEGWTENLETQFKNKIDTLSKVNHRNFVNLIGYCEEEKPFTRMMVFEFAPQGTLFEHLHGLEKDSQHLNWRTRLRIAMGIACCLDYMHQLSPPIAHWNLQSSSIYLTEDYAAKISDFSLWNEVIAAKIGSETMKLLETPTTDPDSNIYSFGMILLEMITGKFPPFSVHEALECFKEGRPLGEIVDPTLQSFKEEDISKLADLVKLCLNPISEERPRMSQIVARLREITGLKPDAAKPNPKPPSHWFTELEVLSTEM